MLLTPTVWGQFLNVDFASRPFLLWVLTCWCALMAGCADSEQEEQQSNLRFLAAYYNQYRAHHRGQLPADEKDFKNFITKSGASTNVDSIFVSNRDGKPYVVKYRGDKSWPHPEIIAYEQEGRDESREVATVVGGYEKLSEEEFQKQMTAGAVKR
jgi:hypothetical protein